MGLRGLVEQPRTPHTNPNQYPEYIKAKIIELRTNKNNRRIIGSKIMKKRLRVKFGIEASRSGIAKFYPFKIQRESLTNLNQARKKFRDFLHYYNYEREHQGIEELTPFEKLQTVPEFANLKKLKIN